nr:flippase [Dissulfurirhabdus thermomarina]
MSRLRERVAGDRDLAELVRGSGVFLVLRVLGMAAAYGFTLLVTRRLGAEAWGLFALAFTVLQVAGMAGRLGLDLALLRFVAAGASAGRPGRVKDVFLKALGLGLPAAAGLALVIHAAAGWLADAVFRKPGLAPLLELAAWALPPYVALYLVTESLRGLKRTAEYGFYQLALPFLWAAAAFYLAAGAGLSPRYALWVYVQGMLAALAAALVSWTARSGLLRVRREPFLPIRELVGVSFPMMVTTSLGMVMNWTDILMLGVFRAEAEVGIYNVAVRLATVTSLALVAVNSIAAPKFSEFWGRGDVAGLGRVARQSTRMIFWWSAPVLAVFLAAPGPLLGLFGAGFEAGAAALVILTLAQFVNASCGSVGYILQMTGHHVAARNIVAAATVMNVGLNAVLIPFFGMNGAAAASAACMVFWNAAMVVYIRRNLGVWTVFWKGGGR